MPYKHSDRNTTGDIGMTTTGKNLKELFSDSARGLIEIMADSYKLLENSRLEVELRSDSLSELYYDWLSEIIYLKDAKQFLVKRIEFIQLDKSGTLKATLCGDTIDPGRHTLKIDVKAVTYYRFNIEKRDNDWFGEVVFDL